MVSTLHQHFINERAVNFFSKLPGYTHCCIYPFRIQTMIPYFGYLSIISISVLSANGQSLIGECLHHADNNRLYVDVMSKMKTMEMQFLRRYQQLEYQLQEIRISQNVSTEKTNSTDGTYD